VSHIISRAGGKKSQRKTTPKWITETAEYKQTLEDMLEHVPLDNASPFDALRAYKDMLWAATAIAMRSFFISKQSSPESQMQLVLQAARAVVEQDAHLARLVKRDSMELDEMIGIETGTVYVVHPRRFDDFAIRTAAASLARESDEANDRNKSRKKRGGLLASIERRLKAWTPLRRLVLSVAIILPTGELATTQEESDAALAAHWETVFSPKRTCSDAAAFLFERVGGRVDFSTMPTR
jgi:hypothetical protein